MFKSHGSGPVSSRDFQISRVGSDRVKRCDEKLTGPVRLLPARNGSLAGRGSMTPELFSADPWGGPAHAARGPDTEKTFRSLTPRMISYQYSIILFGYKYSIIFRQ